MVHRPMWHAGGQQGVGRIVTVSSDLSRPVATRLRRAAWSALFAFAAAGCSFGAAGDAAGGPYDRPGRLVEIPDGRKLNLRCAGRGSPTVILESGFGATSAAWSRVQPALARTTRTCSYDRAGYGFSDPAPTPRDGAAVARDLDQLLQAAEVEGPYVVVGHSAGALYGRLFAARRPGEVTGLVLLDPTVEQVVRGSGRDGLDGLRRRLQRCLTAAEAVPQPPPEDPRWNGCVPQKATPAAAKAARSAGRWENQLSELDAIFGRTSAQALRIGGLLESVPTYVITASDTANAAPTIGYDQPQSVWELQHVALASRFRNGSQRTVLSSHLVMVDRPELVIESVLAMVAALRAGEPPGPLGPNEGEAQWQAEGER